jgi:hypothetical protein
VASSNKSQNSSINLFLLQRQPSAFNLITQTILDFFFTLFTAFKAPMRAAICAQTSNTVTSLCGAASRAAVMMDLVEFTLALCVH